MKLYILIIACIIAWVTTEYGEEKPLPSNWRWTSLRADTANCKAFLGQRPTLFSARAVSLRCTSAAPGYVAARFSFPLDGIRGKRVGMFAIVRAEDVSDSARAWLRVDRPGHFGWQSDDMEKRPIKGTTDWVTVVVSVDVPEDANLLMGGIALVGSGTISISAPFVAVVSPNMSAESLAPPALSNSIPAPAAAPALATTPATTQAKSEK